MLLPRRGAGGERVAGPILRRAPTTIPCDKGPRLLLAADSAKNALLVLRNYDFTPILNGVESVQHFSVGVLDLHPPFAYLSNSPSRMSGWWAGVD